MLSFLHTQIEKEIFFRVHQITDIITITKKEKKKERRKCLALKNRTEI